MSLSYVNKWLPDSPRDKRFLIYQPTADSLTLNKVKLHESVYAFNYKATHVHARGVIVSGYAVFGRDFDLYALDSVDKAPVKMPATIERYVETAIALSHYQLKISCIFNNFLFALFAIPMDIIKKSVFILPSSKYEDINREFFTLFFPKNELMFLSAKQFALVGDFHTICDPCAGIQHYSYGIIYSVNYMKNKLNVTNIKATVYGYSNRNAKYGRSIKNFKELTNAIENKFTGRQWIFVPDDYRNFKEVFSLYCTLKALLTIVGSNCIPVIFMNEGTGVFFISTHRFDWECVAYTTAVNLWCYYYAVPGFAHFSNKKPQVVNVPLVCDLFGELIYAVENEKWSEKTLELNKGFKRQFVENPS